MEYLDKRSLLLLKKKLHCLKNVDKQSLLLEEDLLPGKTGHVDKQSLLFRGRPAVKKKRNKSTSSHSFLGEDLLSKKTERVAETKVSTQKRNLRRQKVASHLNRRTDLERKQVTRRETFVRFSTNVTPSPVEPSQEGAPALIFLTSGTDHSSVSQWETRFWFSAL